MPSKSALPFGVIFCLFVVWSLTGRSQEHTVGSFTRQDRPTPTYFGTDACIGCHNRDQPYEDKMFPPLCECQEYKVWEKQDKHQQAFELLASPRGKRIGELLGIADVQKAAPCLSCHAVDVKPGVAVDPRFKLSDGVSCAVCHGFYAEWVDEHGSALQARREKWRQLARQDKELRKGMIDLWDPVKRTQLCVSCHIGNAEENKVVTHEMYAAGHPPLPSFEIATFSELMPRHWKYVAEKSPEVQKLLGFKPWEARFERTRLVLLGGATAFRQAQTLLASEAGNRAKETDPAKGWPELAQFDCYACHHDLKSDSWRQKRGYVGKPGRPEMRRWPLELVELSALQAGRPANQVASQLQPLYQSFNAVPFGHPDAIAAEARKNVAWAAALLKDLETKPINEKTALSLLHELANIGPQELPDYDSVRQIAWAFRVIYAELYAEKKPVNDAQIQNVLGALSKELKLDLPATQQQSIEANLKVGLEKISAYDPERFKMFMSKLAGLLPPREK